MSKPNSASIVLRERLCHPLVGELDHDKGLDSPLNCAQGNLLANVIEDMWEFLPEEKRLEISARMKDFNQL
jgi:hypothetical protein